MQGEAGLTFTPTSGSLANGSFDVEEWTAIGRVGNVATGTITVLSPIAERHQRHDRENAQTSKRPGDHAGPSGYFVGQRLPDHRHYRRVLVPQPRRDLGYRWRVYNIRPSAAGLTFTPTDGSLTSGSFTVQDSTTADTSGLLGTSTAATITVAGARRSTSPRHYRTGLWLSPGPASALIRPSNTADVSAYKGQQAFQIAGDQPIVGTCNWDTTTVPDGHYELCVTSENAAGNSFSQATCEVLVNNTAAWYSGTITTDETWTNSQVNVVDGTVTIGRGGDRDDPARGDRQVLPRRCGITMQSGATLDAPRPPRRRRSSSLRWPTTRRAATPTWTAARRSQCPGTGPVSPSRATGRSLTSQYTDLRYLVEAESGTLSASEDWLGA